MAQHEARRQKKLQNKRRRDKKRKKERRGQQGYPQISAEKTIRRARELPLHECLINPSWREQGIANIIVSRKEPDGSILFGVYLLDLWCLGLKDTFCEAGMSRRSYKTHLVDSCPAEGGLVECPSELAHTIIYGAVDFAAGLGFRPHSDFALSRHVLEARGSFEPIEGVEFGRDGKPFFVAGPKDDAKRVLDHLETLGDGNYDAALPQLGGDAAGAAADLVVQQSDVAPFDTRYRGPADAPDRQAARPVDLQVERLKRLPPRPQETWQGGLFRIPGWIDEGEAAPYRPVAAVWVDARTGVIHVGDLCSPGQENLRMVLDALVGFATDESFAGYRPGRLEVNRSDLAEWLEGTLAEMGVEVCETEDQPAVQAALDNLAESLGGPLVIPSALEGEGVTPERMRAFAEAACDFYQTRPWEQLSDEDVIGIEASRPDRRMRFTVVLGAGGMVQGLAFYKSLHHYWKQREAAGELERLSNRTEPLWSLMYDDITNLPLADADLWEEDALPTAGEHAYPCAMAWNPGDTVDRPDAGMLSYMEGLLRALAATSEDELDAGRWTKQVQTFDGAATFTLSLPFLLEPPTPGELMDHRIMPDRRAMMERSTAQFERFMTEQDFDDAEDLAEAIGREFIGKPRGDTEYPPLNDQERAQDICYQAFDALGRRKVLLARQALEIWPDCADAYVILAERSTNVADALEYFTEGAEAGQRALGEEVFREQAGHFWGILETRPFMRAKLGVAQCLAELDRGEEAVEHYRELLRLNPSDNQGVRYFLLPLLIRLGTDREAQELFDAYPTERQATWAFCRALLEFRRSGDSPRSRKLLRKAVKTNKHVARLLSQEDELPPMPDYYAPGSEEEAIVCAETCAEAWEVTPGALKWLAARAKV